MNVKEVHGGLSDGIACRCSADLRLYLLRYVSAQNYIQHAYHSSAICHARHAICHERLEFTTTYQGELMAHEYWRTFSSEWRVSTMTFETACPLASTH